MQSPYVHDEEIDEAEIEEIEEEVNKLDFSRLDPNNWLTPELMEQLSKDGINLPKMEDLQKLAEKDIFSEVGSAQPSMRVRPKKIEPRIESRVGSSSVEPEKNQAKKKRQIKPEHRNYAAMLHLSSLLLIMRIPFANVVLPALLWLYKKDSSKFIDFNGREVINFQISLLIIEFIFSFAGLILMYLAPSVPLKILHFTTPIRYMINSVVPLPVTIFTVVPFFIAVNCIIVGAIQAYRGVGFRYKFSYPFTELPKLLANVKGVDIAAKSHAR